MLGPVKRCKDSFCQARVRPQCKFYFIFASSSSAFHTDLEELVCRYIASFPVIILYGSIRYLLDLLFSKFVNPHLINLSSYVNFPSPLIILVIGVDLGGRGSPGTCPPIIEKRPCIYHFLPPFALQYFDLQTQYF